MGQFTTLWWVLERGWGSARRSDEDTLDIYSNSKSVFSLVWVTLLLCSRLLYSWSMTFKVSGCRYISNGMISSVLWILKQNLIQQHCVQKHMWLRLQWWLELELSFATTYYWEYMPSTYIFNFPTSPTSCAYFTLGNCRDPNICKKN